MGEQSRHDLPGGLSGDASNGGEREGPVYQVEVHYPDGSHEPFRFESSTLYIGRDTQNDLRLAYPRIASRHLMVQVGRRDFMVTDLGTAGESQLHGEVLEPHMPYRVREGEMFQIGSLRLALEPILEVQPVEFPRAVPAASESDDYLPAREFDGIETLRSELDQKLSDSARERRRRNAAAGQRRDFAAWREEQMPARELSAPVDLGWPRMVQIAGAVLVLLCLLALVVLVLL